MTSRPSRFRIAALVMMAAMSSCVVRSSAQVTPELVEAFMNGTVDHIALTRAVKDAGSAAVKPIVEVLDRSGADPHPIRVATLVGLLGEIGTSAAQEALQGFLRHEAPRVRALAASVIAARGLTCAVPALIELIGDEAIHSENVDTHPERVTPVTVSDTALDALRKLTQASGARGQDTTRQRSVFEDWWHRNGAALHCG